MFSRPVRVFLVGSEFFHTPGGIQRVNCLLLRMFADVSRSTPLEVEVFSFGDDAASLPREFSGIPCFRWYLFEHSRSELALRLARRLQATHPHLVLFTHAHLLRLGELVSYLAPRAKLAVLGHGVEVWKPLASQIRRRLRRADAVMAPSAYTRAKMIEQNQADPAQVAVLPHGLDPGWVQLALADPVPPRLGCTMLSVTRIGVADAYKGLDVVLRALPEIRRRHPQVRYRIAGDGDDRPRLEKLARDLQVKEHVEFCGEVSSARLHELYRDADAFVLPSRKEGFGIVFLEAMYYRLPVVAARVGGTLDVVVDGVTGALVAPEQPEELARIVCDLFADPARRAAWGEAGRRRVEQNYLFSHFNARWQRWLAALLPEAVYGARQSAAFARSRMLGESAA